MSDVEAALPAPIPPRERWGPVVAGWFAVAALLGAWWLATPDLSLRNQLKLLQPWWLDATFVAAAASLGMILRTIGRKLVRRDYAVLAALGALAVSITLLVAPRTSRIYYDEQIYQAIAQNLTDVRLAQMCNDGTVEYGRLQCWSGEYNKQPYGYPHLLSLAYRLFGVRADLAFAVNAATAALTPMAIYLLVLVLSSCRTAALFAGLVMALTPEQAIWAATAAVEPSASLACAVAALGVAQFCQDGDDRSLFGAAVLAAYAVQFRTESLLIVPAIAFLLFSRRGAEFRRPRLWSAGLLALVLLAVHAAHLFAVRNESWGSPDARLSVNYVAQNLVVNGRFYLWDERFPMLFTAAAVVGVLSRGSSGARGFLLAYFLAFFGIDLFFYAGSYNYGADVRYSLMTYPPLAVLAGFGLAAGVRRLETDMKVPGWLLVTAALLAQALWYAPLVRATTEEAWAARADVRFAAETAPALRGNQYVLTHNPGMFHVWGVNAGQLSLVTGNPSYLQYLLSRYTGGVYLHWSFWCNTADAAQRELCEKARALEPTEPFREYRERDQRFAFYRFVPAGGTPLPSPAPLSHAAAHADKSGR